MESRKILFAFLEPSKSKASRYKFFSQVSTIDHDLCDGTGHFSFADECKQHIENERFWAIILPLESSIASASSCFKNETAIANSLLGLIRNIFLGFTFSLSALLASDTAVKYKATSWLEMLRNHKWGCSKNLHVNPHISWWEKQEDQTCHHLIEFSSSKHLKFKKRQDLCNQLAEDFFYSFKHFPKQEQRNIWHLSLWKFSAIKSRFFNSFNP